MRIVFTRGNMVDTGWKLTNTPLGLFAEREDPEGGITLFMRDQGGDRLEFTPPKLESFNDGKFMAHLFDVLAENNTNYTLV
jgi:hypothetical protein